MEFSLPIKKYKQVILQDGSFEPTMARIDFPNASLQKRTYLLYTSKPTCANIRTLQ